MSSILSVSFTPDSQQSQWHDSGYTQMGLPFNVSSCVQLSLTSRKSTYTTIPDLLFSSLKYRLFLEVNLGATTTPFPATVTNFLMAKLEVVDAATYAPLPVKGNLTASVSAPSGAATNVWRSGELLPELEPSQKHQDSLFRFRVSLKDPQGAVFAMMDSAPFRVLARRPTQQPGIRSLKRSATTANLDSDCDIMGTFRKLSTADQQSFLAQAVAYLQSKGGYSGVVPQSPIAAGTGNLPAPTIPASDIPEAPRVGFPASPRAELPDNTQPAEGPAANDNLFLLNDFPSQLPPQEFAATPDSDTQGEWWLPEDGNGAGLLLVPGLV